MQEQLYRLAPEQCALVVVDIQERLMGVINGREQVVSNGALLIKAANVLNIPVIATTQYVERIGPVLPEIAAELQGATPHDKLEFSCFANAAIRQEFTNLDPERKTLIVCGVETHICVYQTVLAGLMEGYRMWVAGDAVSSRTEANHANGLARIGQIGGVVASTEMVIYELLGKAGSPEFKALLPHLK